MTKELIDEIENNLRIRKKVKEFFNAPKTRYIIENSVEEGIFIISAYLQTLMASYNDLLFYLIQLHADEFFANQEIDYVMKAFTNKSIFCNDDEDDNDSASYADSDEDDNDAVYYADSDEDDNDAVYYADSDELILAIGIKIKAIKKELRTDSLQNIVHKEKEQCKNKYELYILQRAAFDLDYMIFDDSYTKFEITA